MPIKKDKNLTGIITRRLRVPADKDKRRLLLDLAGKVRAKVRVRGKRSVPAAAGVVLLFAGSEGTGKTMAAEILSKALNMDLYRVDLAGVISKYIGETEKNLNKLFDEARTSNAVLLFDEADALFGKRSEIKDSHDRFGNVDTDYLLRRLETYPGVVILATNYKQNIDPVLIHLAGFTVEFAGTGGETKVTVRGDDSADADRARGRGK